MIQKINNSPSFQGYRINKASFKDAGYVDEAIRGLKSYIKVEKTTLNKYSKGYEFRILAEGANDLYVSAHPKAFIKPSDWTYGSKLAPQEMSVKYPNTYFLEDLVAVFKKVSENITETKSRPL